MGFGVTKVVIGKDSDCIATMGGILQFAHNQATILTDIAELECDIDVARARQAKIRAEARLRARDENIDMARVQVALAKAIARISAKDKRF